MEDLSEYALDLRPRRRPGFTVSTHLFTWDLVVLRVDPDGPGAPIFLARPQGELRSLLADLDAGRRDEDLHRALRGGRRRTLRRPPRDRPALRTGVEHEYVVRGVDGPVDFRGVVDDLALGVRGDPTDPHAQRCAWGGVVTADGAEAEVATPPVVVRPGSIGTVAALASTGHAALADALPDGVTLEGYSTHLNVSAPRRGEQARALRFATVFAPALMLLLDRPGSPGLLVRPRPGRLELGGEFADGPRLEVALTFAVGAVLAADRLGRREHRRLALDLGLARAVERYGWFVARDAGGEDLYAVGRSTRLRGVDGDTRSAGQHLELCWTVARGMLTGLASAEEIDAVDAVVGSEEPLPAPQGAAS